MLQHDSKIFAAPAERPRVSSRPLAEHLPAWSIESRAGGWPATLELLFARRKGVTRIVDQSHRGPLRIQRPFHPEGGDVSHVYLLHPPAGIVGGDDIRIRVALQDEAHALVTSPGATRFYLSRKEVAQFQQVARVASGSTLEWLPQEALFMRGARAKTVSRIDLEGDARFFGWEILGFGRPALGEAFAEGQLETRLEIYRDGQPLMLDCYRVDDGRVEGLEGHSAVMTLVATGADDEVLERTRAVLEDAGDTMIAATRMDDLLVVRGIADRCEPLFTRCVEIWRATRPRLLGRAVSIPRIWLT
jgi:urease accessory protein